jgi:hypothetical protein
MTPDRKKTGTKALFPAGIFFLLFLIQMLASAGGISYYFFHKTKNDLTEIEKYTLNYSKTLAEAFADVAELSYRNKNYSSLKSLFREKIEENTIDEAFFVLKDGTLIVHSNTTIEKKLRGNIANDEMAYNLDLILQPVNKKSRDLFFSNYNIIEKKIPFNRSLRGLIKEHLYSDINSSGWIFTRGVFHRGKPAGTVNFIVSKDRIHTTIFSAAEDMKKVLLIALALSLGIAFIVSILIMFRFRKRLSCAEDSAAMDEAEVDDEYIEVIPEEEKEIVFESDYYSETPEIENYSPGESGDETYDYDFSFDEETSLQEKTTSADEISDTFEDEDEYITIELLGEIDEDDETEVKNSKKSSPSGVKIIASVVIDENIANKQDIPDAIPVKKEM